MPAGPFDVVLLLETMLAFPDKLTLLHAVSSALAPGGRFAFTLEEGDPLSAAERALMPAADTVWPIPMPELLSQLTQAGLQVSWQGELTRPHQATVALLGAGLRRWSRAHPGARRREGMDELQTAHRLWNDWLRQGRVRKFAFVVEKAAAHPRVGGGRAGERSAQASLA